MNYAEVNLDLQGTAKRIYESLLYNSQFYKFLNPNYIGELRQAGVPMIEVIKSNDTTVNVRSTKEIANQLTPSLMGYNSIKVDLTDLPMDYSIRVPLLVGGSDITNVLEDTMRKKDQAVARQIDEYGFGLLDTEVAATFTWNPATQDDYINYINELKADLFNKNVYEGYRMGLAATEYGKLVSALTSILKFETAVGVKGVDMGTVSTAYGVEIFEINDNVLGSAKGYFYNNLAVVGDAFIDAMAQFNSPQGYPGYYVLEGNILFGAKVVEQNAIIKLSETASA